MQRKIISAVLAVAMLTGFAACKKVDNTPETTTEQVTTAAATSEATTVTTTAAPTTTATTTKPTASTTKPTTAEKVTTTVKKVVTTIAKTTEKSTLPAEYRTENDTETVMLKYGVIRTRGTVTTYAKLEDGSEEVYDVEISELFNRIGYYATYDDLLPAAEENRKEYKSEIKKVLEIINSYRKEGGLKPLELDDKLTTVACARAEELAWSGRFSHYRPNGKYFSSILKDAGINKGSAGENIGRGYDSPEAVCEAWKASESHYENIMNPDFTKIGIGVAADPDSDGKLCWSQLFITAT